MVAYSLYDNVLAQLLHHKTCAQFGSLAYMFIHVSSVQEQQILNNREITWPN